MERANRRTQILGHDKDPFVDAGAESSGFNIWDFSYNIELGTGFLENLFIKVTGDRIRLR